MEIALWIAQGVLAAAFLVAGLTKVSRTKEQLEANMGWVEDFSPGFVKFIGVVETLAALGLIVPGITGIAPMLTPIAATGLAVAQVGAVAVHVRRNEARVIWINLIFIAIAVFIAWGRFGDYPL